LELTALTVLTVLTVLTAQTLLCPDLLALTALMVEMVQVHTQLLLQTVLLAQRPSG
jgi:hypothetical protein